MVLPESPIAVDLPHVEIERHSFHERDATVAILAPGGPTVDPAAAFVWQRRRNFLHQHEPATLALAAAQKASTH